MYKTVTGRYQIKYFDRSFCSKKKLHIFISIWQAL